MNDLEQHLHATRALLPEPPPPPEAVFAAMRAEMPSSAGRRRGSQSRRRRRQIGGAMAFAVVASVAGLAAAGVLPTGLPSSAQESLDMDEATVVGTVQGGAENVVIAPGHGRHAGELCLSLANRMGPKDVSPVVCQPSERVDDPGFRYAIRPPNADGWLLHVRIPDGTDVSSAVISEAVIPERGGVVTFDSAGREISETFPDTADLDAQADRDARAYDESLRRTAREGLETATAQRMLPSLPPDERRALELRVIEGLAWEEIASRQNVSVAEARDRVSRSLKFLGVDMGGMLP